MWMALRHSKVDMYGYSSFCTVSVSPVRFGSYIGSEYSEPTIYKKLFLYRWIIYIKKIPPPSAADHEISEFSMLQFKYMNTTISSFSYIENPEIS